MVTFNPEIIGELRQRVIAHNERVAEGPKLKLGQMKGLYKRWCAGRDAHAHALRKIDEHLATLEAAAILEKARRPFDEGRHPRGRRGEFRPTGEQPSGGQGRFYQDVASREAHRDLADENAGYGAFQTQVIPETRYSTLGPAIAGAAGVAAGAAAGSVARFRGTPIDRALATGAGHVTGKLGAYVASSVAVPTIVGGRIAARGGIQAINRALGTRIPRPAPAAGERLIEAIERAGNRVGRIAGRAAVTIPSMINAAGPAAARAMVEHFSGGGIRGTVLSHVGGALAGAAIPGLLYGHTLSHLQQMIGPYEDTLFPRRVRKIVGPLFDDEAVLAKEAELLADDLTKAEYGAVTARIIALLRPRVAPILNAAAGVGPTSPAHQAAQAAFAEHAAHFLVKPLRAARAALTASHVGALAGGGAGLGAIAGAAAGSFNAKHPRDPKGRFSTKAQGSIAGAKYGAAVGAGLGLVSGLIAARGGHNELIQRALKRLAGETEVEGTNLLAAMQTKTEANARTAHAAAYADQNQRLIGAAPGRSLHEHVVAVLRRKGMPAGAGHARTMGLDEFDRTEGAAMQAGAKTWYRFQLDRAFDARVRGQIGKLGPIPAKGGGRAARDMIDTVDVDALSTGQRKIWDNLVERRDKTLGEIEDLYEGRAEAVRVAVTARQDLTAERQKLLQAVRTVPDSWDDLKVLDDLRLPQLRAFAKARLGHDLEAKSVKAGIEEIEGRVGEWLVESNHRLAQIDNEIVGPPEIDELRNHQHADLDETELRGIRNPFNTSQKSSFFRNRPVGAEDQAGFQRIREAVAQRAIEPFTRSADEHVSQAMEHLNTLIGAQEAALRGSLPKRDVITRAFSTVAPALAGRMHQAVEDLGALATARRESLTGTPRLISDWMHAHQNPQKAWETTKTVANATLAQGKKAAGFALRNWKVISGIAGPLAAMTEIDLSKPGGLKRAKFRRPNKLGVVHDRPDVIKRPDEALFGVSYRDKQNRERFLHGIHITSATGDYRSIPFGADVEQVKNTIRSGTGGAPKADAVPLDAKAQTDLSRLKTEGHIGEVGPAGFLFAQRTGGNAGTVERDVQQVLFNKHLKWMEQPSRDNPGRPRVAVGRSNDRRERYYESLRDVFEAPGAEAMGAGVRAGLLVGTQEHRGIFANPDHVYQSGDKDKITRQLLGQVKVHAPLNSEGAADEYTQAKRAFWLASQHLGLSGAQQDQVLSALDKEFTNASSKTIPESAEAAKAPQAAKAPETTAAASGAATAAPGQSVAIGSDADAFNVYFASLSDRGSPRYVSPHRRTVTGPGGAEQQMTDAQFRDALHSLYMVSLRDFRKREPGSPSSAAHRHAARIVDQLIDAEFNIGKVEPIAGMAKRLDDQGFAPAATRAGRSGAPITGAAGRAALQRGAPGGAQTSVGTDLRAATQPSHVLGQLGSYGLSQAGWDGIENLTAHLLPGGGMIANAAKYGLKAIGSAAGAYAGGPLGQGAGRILGDTSQAPVQSGGESAVRGVAGGAGQIAYNAYGNAPVKAAASGLWSRAAGVVGRAIGGAAEGAETGAELGTAAEPGGGTLVGGAVGAVAGLLGAGVAGALTDEGAGILYRHLGSYGSHVPKMAAEQLGYTGKQPSAAISGAAS